MSHRRLWSGGIKTSQQSFDTTIIIDHYKQNAELGLFRENKTRNIFNKIKGTSQVTFENIYIRHSNK